MSIVAVSDVHLGKDGANEEKFIEFLKQLNLEEIKHLVLLGDIIDFWRCDFTKAFLEYSEVLKLLSDLASKIKVHYVVGNHDYYLLRLSQVNGQNFPFEVSKSITLQSESKQPSEKPLEFYFIHGYQLEVLCNRDYKSMRTYETFSEQLCLAGDRDGGAANKVWKLIQSSRSILDCLNRIPEDPYEALKSMMEPPETRIRKYGERYIIEPVEELAKSDIRHFLLGIKPDQFLVYGHTHRPTKHPYEPELRNVANTGSWGFGEDNKLCYLEIHDDTVYNRVF